jgi:hypothetical protein
MAAAGMAAARVQTLTKSVVCKSREDLPLISSGRLDPVLSPDPNLSTIASVDRLASHQPLTSAGVHVPTVLCPYFFAVVGRYMGFPFVFIKGCPIQYGSKYNAKKQC